MKKIILNIEYSFVVFLLIIGLCVSSIGITWCRYQKLHYQNVSFIVRNSGNFYVTNHSNEWTIGEDGESLFLHFNVTNSLTHTPPYIDYVFYLRWNSSVNVENVRLIHTQSTGREVTYKGVLVNQDGFYEYSFYDENGKEISFDLLGDNISIQSFRLETSGVEDSFFSEVSIYDASYDIKSTNAYSISQYQPLEVSSNYLSESELLSVRMENSLDITLTANKNVKSQISYFTESELVEVTLNGLENVSIDLEANKEETVTLDVSVLESLEPTTETVTVVWCVFNDKDEVIRELSADFLVDIGTESVYEKPHITLKYVDEKNVFSKYQPLVLEIVSENTSKIELKEGMLPEGTRYSLDGGFSWYVLSKESGIDLFLEANTTYKIIIDFEYAKMKWENEVFYIQAYYGNESLAELLFYERNETIDLVEVINKKMGIINRDVISFTLNIDQVDIVLEYLDNGIYQEIDKNLYFTWDISDHSYIIHSKENMEIPKGTYRIRITQKNQEKILKEILLSFFVIEGTI